MDEITPSMLNEVADEVDQLEMNGFTIRKIDIYPDHFLLATNHGDESGAVSRWSSSWVRRYEFK